MDTLQYFHRQYDSVSCVNARGFHTVLRLVIENFMEVVLKHRNPIDLINEKDENEEENDEAD